MTNAKVIGILQPSYLPWLGFFEQMAKTDVFVFYDDVQFEKGSWRNRNRIKTPQGLQWLTVPVLTKNKGTQLIKDITVNPAVPWARNHIKTITQNYSKAPYFDPYSKELFQLIEKPKQFLLDLNIELTAWLCRVLGISTKTVLSSELGFQGDRLERLIQIILHLGGNVFYEGASGRNYIDLQRFEEAGIAVDFQDYVHPVYKQLYRDFIPYLSVIDLLFNHGPDSLEILKGTVEG